MVEFTDPFASTDRFRPDLSQRSSIPPSAVSAFPDKSERSIGDLYDLGDLEDPDRHVRESGNKRPYTYKALRVTLSASLDPTITTEALRVYLGIADLVWSRREREDKVAYVGMALVYLASGVDPRTVCSERHLASLRRLGLELVADGQRGKVEDGHGLATAWDACRSKFSPQRVDPVATPLLGRFLDPVSAIWGADRGASSGWRLAVALTAMNRMDDSMLNLSELAAIRGCQRPMITKSLQRLERLGVARKIGRSWVWDPAPLRDELRWPEHSSPLTDCQPVRSRERAYLRLRDWQERRDAWMRARDEEERAAAKRLLGARR